MPFGSNVGNFTTGAFTNESGNTTYFTATSVEMHHVFERIVDFSVGHNSPVSVPPKTINKWSTQKIIHSSHLTSEFYEW